MDLVYFCNQIDNEISGAKDYIKKAIEIKPMNPDWAKQFSSMSEAEKDHALKLYTMMNTYVAKLEAGYRETPKYIRKATECARDSFSKGVEELALFYSAYEKL